MNLHALQNAYMNKVLPVGQSWFTVREISVLSGWGESYVKREIKNGILQGQAKSSESNKGRAYRTATTNIKPQYRVHRRDLITWLCYQGNFSPLVTIKLMLELFEEWPPFMQAAFRDVLGGGKSRKQFDELLERCHTAIPQTQPKRSHTTTLNGGSPDSTETIQIFNADTGKYSAEALQSYLKKNATEAGESSTTSSAPTCQAPTQSNSVKTA